MKRKCLSIKFPKYDKTTFIPLTDWDLLPDLSHGSVSQGKIHTMASQQARLLAHALSCEYISKHTRRYTNTVHTIQQTEVNSFVMGTQTHIKTLLKCCLYCLSSLHTVIKTQQRKNIMEDYSLHIIFSPFLSVFQSQRFKQWSTAHAQCILRKMNSW